MTYPFVQAHNDYGPRKGPVRAFLIHMAEGGGTVGYLSRPNPRGVSVHYVIERDGRIVQMLKESHASGSVNPNDIRTSNGPAPYGATAAKAVMGSWWKDPNSAVISLEIEGYASKGPNIVQRNSLASLVADVRSRYPSMGLLGHRDFADYKACPGAYIPWPKLGGHGVHVAPSPPQMTWSVRIEAGATIRAYTLAGLEVPHCIESWEDVTWDHPESTAACMKPVFRKTCDGRSSATTVFIPRGAPEVASRHIRIGRGVHLVEETP